MALWAPTGFFAGVGNEEYEGRKSTNGVQGHSPGEGLRAKFPEADDIYLK